MNTRHRNSPDLSPIKAWLRRGIHFMYEVFIEPRTEDEDSKRHEFILNTILSCLLPLLIILDVFIAIASIREGSSYVGIPFVAFTAVVLGFIYLLILSRSGHYKTASFILLSINFLATTYGAVRWTIWLPFVVISYVLIIVISSILISTRFSFITTGVIVLTISSVTYLQTTHIIQPHMHWKYAWISMNEPIQISIVFFIITAISWLSNREMERSLDRARRSEQALLEERDLLEIKVEERTKELKIAQKDKLSQLYRFAEFGKLSSGVFHDLMNSLNIVVNNVSQLETNQEQLPEVKTHIHKAVTASHRMGDYLQSVRKQIAVRDIESLFSSTKEINDAVDMVHFKAREAHVAITLDTEDVIIHGNAVKFYQLVLNLLVNAIEACEVNENESIVAIQLKKLEDDALLIIEDNGCGIEASLLDTIFTQFFTTKAYGKGIGLGLSQTKEIVEQEFKGTIRVISTVNIGTRFIITLPITTHDHYQPEDSDDL